MAAIEGRCSNRLSIFDGRHFGAPNKGTKRSAREPSRRAPLLGSSDLPMQRMVPSKLGEGEGEGANNK